MERLFQPFLFLAVVNLRLYINHYRYTFCNGIMVLPFYNYQFRTMKKFHTLLLLSSLTLLIPMGCVAQKNTGNTAVNTYKTIYAKAVEYGDLNTAIGAAHNILAISPADYHFMDSLVNLYYEAGNLVAAINVGNDILAAAPQNVAVREMVANSQMELGLSGEAIQNYQDLYTRTSNLVYLYTIAITQFEMKNYTESGATVEKLLTAEGNLTKISIAAADGSVQAIPIKAAAYNIKGAIAVEVNNPTIAKQNFEEALRLAPEFALAKQNLAALGKK